MKVIELDGQKFELVEVYLDVYDEFKADKERQQLYALKPLETDMEGVSDGKTDCSMECDLINRIFEGESRESWYCRTHKRPYFPYKANTHPKEESHKYEVVVRKENGQTPLVMVRLSKASYTQAEAIKEAIDFMLDVIFNDPYTTDSDEEWLLDLINKARKVVSDE